MGTDNDRIQKKESQLANIQAEKAVLDGIFRYYNIIMHHIKDIVTPESFYEETNGVLFAAMLQLYEDNQPISLQAVTKQLESKGQIDAVGNALFETEITDTNIDIQAVLEAAEIVRDKAILRNVSNAGETLINIAGSSSSGFEAVRQAELVIIDVAHGVSRSQIKSADGLVPWFFDELAERYSSKQHISGLSTGYADLDTRISGLGKKELIVLSGWAGEGKSAFALNLLLNVAANKVPVGFFSLEMGIDQIMGRVVSSLTRVPLSSIRSGQLSDEHWDSLYDAAEILMNGSCPLYMDDSPNLSLKYLAAKARQMKRDYDIGFLVVDSLQLIKIGWDKEQVDDKSEASITTGLKALAKDLDIPVIVISQLSWEKEQHENMRPSLSDLPKPYALEQNADVILFFETDSFERGAGSGEDEKFAKVIIAKHRNEPCGEVEFLYRKDCVRLRSKKSS